MATRARRRRRRGTGGIKPVREGVWRVDVELPREPGSPRRRRSRLVHGSITDAERVLAELRARPDAPVETMSAQVSADLADAVRLAAAGDGVSVAEEIRIAFVERTKRVG